MAKVVPTVLAATPEEYRRRLEGAQGLSYRIHVDICDGRFADRRTVNLAQVYAGKTTELDLHLMVENPDDHIETAFSLHPSLVIIHAESQGDIVQLVRVIKEMGMRAGVALLPETTVHKAAEAISLADHVLIFTGRLGHNGGEFSRQQLSKVAQIRRLNKTAEISVDGGVNNQVAPLIVDAGVDVLYAGSFLADAPDPGLAYAQLQTVSGVLA